MIQQVQHVLDYLNYT